MREAERMIEEDGCEWLKLPMKIKQEINCWHMISYRKLLWRR
jgi:hypothetical protein